MSEKSDKSDKSDKAPHRTLMQNQTAFQYCGAKSSVIPLLYGSSIPGKIKTKKRTFRRVRAETSAPIVKGSKKISGIVLLDLAKNNAATDKVKKRTFRRVRAETSAPIVKGSKKNFRHRAARFGERQ